MKKINYALALAILATATFTSCKKDNNEPGGNTAALAGKYKLAAMESTDEDGTTDLFPLLEDCVKDDLLELKSDKSYIYTDLGEVCNPNGSDNGVWNMKGADSIVVDGETSAITSTANGKLILVKDVSVPDHVATLKVVYNKQ